MLVLIQRRIHSANHCYIRETYFLDFVVFCIFCLNFKIFLVIDWIFCLISGYNSQKIIVIIELSTLYIVVIVPMHHNNTT